jgi:predicted DNA-binding protein
MNTNLGKIVLRKKESPKNDCINYVRLSQDVQGKVDKLARQLKKPRSSVIRHLIEASIERGVVVE